VSGGYLRRASVNTGKNIFLFIKIIDYLRLLLYKKNKKLCRISARLYLFAHSESTSKMIGDFQWSVVKSSRIPFRVFKTKFKENR
jgi:hypothetical protein